MRAGWTDCGQCTSGSIAPLSDATKRASGGAATTSTTGAERVAPAMPRGSLILQEERWSGRLGLTREVQLRKEPETDTDDESRC